MPRRRTSAARCARAAALAAPPVAPSRSSRQSLSVSRRRSTSSSPSPRPKPNRCARARLLRPRAPRTRGAARASGDARTWQNEQRTTPRAVSRQSQVPTDVLRVPTHTRTARRLTRAPSGCVTQSERGWPAGQPNAKQALPRLNFLRAENAPVRPHPLAKRRPLCPAHAHARWGALPFDSCATVAPPRGVRPRLPPSAGPSRARAPGPCGAACSQLGAAARSGPTRRSAACSCSSRRKS